MQANTCTAQDLQENHSCQAKSSKGAAVTYPVLMLSIISLQHIHSCLQQWLLLLQWPLYLQLASLHAPDHWAWCACSSMCALFHLQFQQCKLQFLGRGESSLQLTQHSTFIRWKSLAPSTAMRLSNLTRVLNMSLTACWEQSFCWARCRMLCNTCDVQYNKTFRTQAASLLNSQPWSPWLTSNLYFCRVLQRWLLVWTWTPSQKFESWPSEIAEQPTLW